MLLSSEFQINVVDCQPVHDRSHPEPDHGPCGDLWTVKFEGNKQRDFNQNFILTAQASPSNSVEDCQRLLPVPGSMPASGVVGHPKPEPGSLQV